MASSKPSPSEKQCAKLRSFQEYFTTGNFVKVIVGPEKKEFILNEELLCDKIPYFQAMFQSGFKETIEKKTALLEDDPQLFGRLVAWVYTNKIYCPMCDGQREGDCKVDIDEPNPEHDKEVFRLWILADKLSAKLAEEVIKMYERCVFTMVSGEGIRLIYENTTGSQLRIREAILARMIQKFYNYRVGIDGSVLGNAVGASLEFNREFMKQISEHLGAGNGECRIASCSIHRSSRSGRSYLTSMPNYNAGDHPKKSLQRTSA